MYKIEYKDDSGEVVTLHKIFKLMDTDTQYVAIDMNDKTQAVFNKAQLISTEDEGGRNVIQS